VPVPTAPKITGPVAGPPAARTGPPARRVRSAGPVRAHETDPDSPGPSVSADLLAEGQQRFDTGDIEGALRSARAAIRAGGGAPAHLLAGRALGKKDQLQDAERELAIAVRLDPTNAFAAQRLREIRERLRTALTAPE
jgi:hypothetical protein